MKSLLLLGAGLGSPDVVSRLKDLGLKIVLVELKDVFDRKRACNADEIIITDYRLDSFVDFAIHLRNIWHYDHVLAISEFGVAVAARLNKLLGLRGSDVKSISLLNDKRLMRERLASSGFSHIAYKQLKTAADIRQLVDAAGWPIIIKPQNGAGSRGIHLAHSFEDAEHAFFELRACGETVLAEEYVDGKEYSVETFSFDSRHSVVAITEKIVNEQFIEVGHVVPAMLDAEAAARVGVFVQEFLSIMGVTNGPCHTEMKIGSKGMKIIESHNRFGGGNIPRLVELAYGVDLIRLTGQWVCGLIDEAPAFPTTANGAAAIRFFTFPPGEISGIAGLNAIAQNPDVRGVHCHFRIGDNVPELTSNGGRAGYVIVWKDNAQRALASAGEFAAGVQATVLPERPGARLEPLVTAAA